MPECDYCEASFDDEDAYLDHLADSHEGELGAIDGRRVRSRTSDDEGGLPLGMIIVGVIVVLALGLAVYVTQLFGGGSADADGIEAAELNSTGDAQLLSGVEQFQSEGRDHIAPGTDVEYTRTPPLSGTHYAEWSGGGYFETAQDYGNLVHSLEHGAVVIYYTPDAVEQSAGDDETAAESLREFVATHDGRWRHVIIVPNPETDPQAAFVVTAWQHRLYMDSYDDRTVHAFLSEHLGRGPENPVR